MKKRFAKKKQEAKKIAEDRIKELFKQADNVFPKRKDLAKRYVTLAKKIATKVRVKIPTTLRRRFCKHCGSYLRVGTNARIRLHKKRKNYFCMECEGFTRVPYK